MRELGRPFAIAFVALVLVLAALLFLASQGQVCISPQYGNVPCAGAPAPAPRP